MQKIKEISGEYKLVNVPTSYNGVENIEFGYRERTDLHAKDGFLTIVMPIITEFQQIDYNLQNGIVDVSKGTFTYGIIEMPQQTAQQLYDELIEQGKIVFDEFRTSLAKAGVNYLLKGDVPQALKDLVVELETTKSNINQVLQLYLSYNNVAKLKAFRFDTPEAEEFKNRIENFK
jgi:hypothetical protein